MVLKKSNKKKTTKKSKSIFDHPRRFSFIQRTITASFIAIFTIILITVICFEWVPHCNEKTFFLPNIVSLLISLIAGTTIYFLFKKCSIKKSHFRIIIIVSFLILYLIQLLILYCSFFKTGWDVNYVQRLADEIAERGIYTTAGSDAYLTLYKNNVLIVAITAFIKGLPLIGENYLTLLAINALLVNIAGLITCLVIKELVSRKAGVLSIIITAPLLLLSPWIIIPYSDTFTIIIPILVFYIYIVTKKWWKYGLIVFLSILGYFIKPTSIIMLIAILIIEVSRYRWKKPSINKDFWLRTLAIVNGLLLAFLIKYVSYSYINYHQVENVTPASPTHYLAMGQNEETCGQYSQLDVDEMKNGPSFEIQKFCNRIANRSILKHSEFFIKKLLVNYDDGTFAWGSEGSFYREVPERNNPISGIITSFIYNDGEHNNWFNQLEQSIWLLVLFGCILMAKKHPSREESILELSLIGLFLFVMIFEARARYLFCFAPIFVVCATLGYQNLKAKLLAKFS